MFFCSFFKIIVLFYFFFFQSQVWGLPPFQYFHHVPHILRHCTQHHGRSFWRTWPRHQTLISEKWPKIVKKGPPKNMIFIQKIPHILHHCAQHHGHSFWRTCTWPTLHIKLWYYQWDYVFYFYFFIYKIGCTTYIIILRYWIISFSSF